MPRHAYISARQKARTTCLPALLLATMLASSCGINNIPSLDETVNARWANIFERYEQRGELVPTLTRKSESIAHLDKSLIRQVVRDHARVLQMEISPDMLLQPEALQQFQLNQDALTLALNQLMVAMNNHSELSFEASFVTLRQQFLDKEHEIAIARREYVDAVQRYNTELRTIPGRWWAGFVYPNMQPKANFDSAP